MENLSQSQRTGEIEIWEGIVLPLLITGLEDGEKGHMPVNVGGFLKWEDNILLPLSLLKEMQTN